MAADCGVKLWKGGVKPHTWCMNMADLSLKANKGTLEQPAVEHKQMKHPTEHVTCPFNCSTPVTILTGPAWVWVQSVKFGLLKAQQSDQIKTKKTLFTLHSRRALSTSQWDTPDTCGWAHHNVYSPPQREETVDLGSAQTQEYSMYTHTPAYCDKHC